MSYAAPPYVMPTPAVIAINSPWAGHFSVITDSGAGPVSSTSVANEATYAMFMVTTPATFTRGFWMSGTLPDGVTTGCVAIYNPAGTRLATTGAVVVAGASVIQSAAFTASVALFPGVYYMGVSFSAADANGISAYAAILQRGKMSGLYREASAHPLPATATFAAWTASVLPFCGVTTTSFAI